MDLFTIYTHYTALHRPPYPTSFYIHLFMPKRLPLQRPVNRPHYIFIYLCPSGCYTTYANPRLRLGFVLTVENSPNASSVYFRLYKHRKEVFYCFYKTTFPRKKRKTLCMALIKREILTSRKILSTKSCTRNQFLFCKKMLCKIRIFFA